MNNGARVYDDEGLIVKSHDSYNLIRSKQSADGNTLSGSAERLEGMGTIWKYNAPEATEVNIEYGLKVSSGKAKLVLISPDDRITVLTECISDSDAEQSATEALQIEKGKNRIKLIGAKGTEIDFTVSVDKGTVSSFSD